MAASDGAPGALALTGTGIGPVLQATPKSVFIGPTALGTSRSGQIVITNIGPQTVSDSLVRANMRVKEGDPYVRANVDDDVRNLYATGFFSDIRVADEVTPDGVDLHYYLRSKLKLTEINFVGNKKYSSRKLLKKLTSKIGDPLDETTEIGPLATDPLAPVLFSVNVPPATSSGFRRLVRARSTRSLIALDRSVKPSRSASRITGTIRPSGMATATPRFT